MHGQVDPIERWLITDHDSADVWMLLATEPDGINSPMAEVLGGHICLPMLSRDKNARPAAERAEDRIGLVRAYGSRAIINLKI
jgi:DNA-binding FrmR family transcriptional regulator